MKSVIIPLMEQLTVPILSVAILLQFVNDAVGGDRFVLQAHSVSEGSSPVTLGSKRFTASVSINQESPIGFGESDSFSLASGYQATTEGFRPGFDGAVDSTGNGIPDLWEIRHFGAVGAAPDTLMKQGRTFPTPTVYVWGVDPHDPNAVLSLDNPGFEGSLLGFSFVSALGREYDVKATTNIVTGPWIIVREGMVGDGLKLTIDDLDVNQFSRRFYRLDARVAEP